MREGAIRVPELHVAGTKGQGRREHSSRHLLGMGQLEAGLVHVNWEGGPVGRRKEASLLQD